jgi:phosphatidylglycerophosphate synthase
MFCFARKGLGQAGAGDELDDPTPYVQFLLAGLVLLALMMLASSLMLPTAFGGGQGATVMLFGAISVVGARGLLRQYPHRRLGLCNLVTYFRAMLVALLAAPVGAPGGVMAVPAVAWTVTALAAAALILDGFDGWLARRSGLVSRFGARFDVEIDALLALILALLAWQAGKAGAWVLLLGLIRYGFVGAGVAWPWLAAALPERRRRKVVCVVQLVCLTALQAPLLGPLASEVIAAAVLVLLVWTFAVDVAWLARQRRLQRRRR